MLIFKRKNIIKNENLYGDMNCGYSLDREMYTLYNVINIS